MQDAIHTLRTRISGRLLAGDDLPDRYNRDYSVFRIEPAAIVIPATVEAFFQREGMLCPMYGHAGSGNFHLRPLFDTTAPNLVGTLRRVADHIYGLVAAYDGTITAEHGMGPLRAPYLEQKWGTMLHQAMHTVKNILDPDGLFASAPMFETRHLDQLSQLLDL